jgi:hypothetical protein
MKGYPGLAFTLAIITASGYLRRDPSHFTYPVTGRWRRWWLALFLADLVVLGLLNL